MITLKKASIVLDRVNSVEILDLRAAYASYFNRISPEDKARCIFIDDSGFNNHVIRTQARARRGARASITVQSIRGAMKTLIVASSCAGILHHKLIFDGTCNGEKFKQFIENLLVKLDSSASTSNLCGQPTHTNNEATVSKGLRVC
ncbi:hypothetical protein ENBRE01_2305 [Enteropsectra breve]|nr:hypothetical protein ENBRE01_2305 [Enteropsectra breve]